MFWASVVVVPVYCSFEACMHCKLHLHTNCIMKHPHWSGVLSDACASAVQVRDLVDHVVVVTDQQIVGAMQLVFERMKLVVEPSGAAGLAAVLAPGFADAVNHARSAAAAGNGPAADAPLNVGVILCGGNLDFESKGFFKMDNWVAHA